MCGIIGYVGKNKNATKILINGLKSLEYRGYDSAGIAYVKDDKILIIKEKGKVENLEKEINFNESSNIGIAHTRWATHGIPEKHNAHPHSYGKITLVHNGIIENYEKIKQKFKDVKFKSETDTEVIAVLLDSIYQKEKDMKKAIVKLKNELEGSYALGIICENEKDKIYAIRKDSPLIVAKSENASLIASDIPAILDFTNKYIILNEDEIAILNETSIDFYNDKLEKINKKEEVFEGDKTSSQKNGYSHFMLKEINEEKDVIKRILKGINSAKDLEKNYSFIKDYQKIDIIACGSAYHIGLVAKYLIEENVNIPVNVEIASEYRYKNNFLNKNDLAIFVSQSGETADTLASLRKVKEQGIDTLAIVNVVGSSIAREAKHVIYTKAGPEIAVATTKAFIAQLVTVILLTLYLSLKNKCLKEEEINKVIKELTTIDEDIDKILKIDYNEIAKKIYDKTKIFFIGRNIDYAISLEGSLKLKEISYIHSEAYAAGELKHGSISLIENNTPVIALLTKDKIRDKTISNIKETKARGSYVISVTNKKTDFSNLEIMLPNRSELVTPILATIPLQLLAFEVAKLNNCDIDKPRNLAKSVTVE